MELLRGKMLLKKSGDTFYDVSAVEALRNVHVVGFYFSAHWCVPCRSFTPILVDCYQDLRLKKKPFEVVFVSADESPESAKTYMKEAHGEWTATVFEDTELHDALAKTFAVVRIPQLVIVKKNGQVITSNGCRDIKELGSEAFNSWADGKPGIRSQEEVPAEEDILDRISSSKRIDDIIGGSITRMEFGQGAGPLQISTDSDEISKSLEKAGIKTATDKEQIKANPTRMLTMREVEKNATENSATSSGSKKSSKSPEFGKDIGGLTPKKVEESSPLPRENTGAIPKDGGAIPKDSAATSKKGEEGKFKEKGEGKGKMALGEGGSNEEKPEKSGKLEPKKKKRHSKKRAVMSRDKDKDEEGKKTEDAKKSAN